MKLFNNLKIGTKILSGFFMVAIIATVIGIVGIVNLNTIANKDTEMYEKMTVPMDDLYDMTESYQKMRGNLKDLIMASTPAEYADYEAKIKARQDIFDENITEFQKTVFTDAAKETLNKVKTSFSAYNEISKQVIVLAKQNKDDAAIALLRGDCQKANNLVEENMQKLTDIKISLAKTAAASNKATASSSRNLMIEFIIVGAALAIGLGIIISRSITKPIKKIVDYADRLALGDVDIEIINETKDEIGTLMIAFKKMIENIHQNVGAAESISKGEFNVVINPKSDKDVLAKSMVLVVQVVNNLEKEVNMLTKAAIVGSLSTRGDSEKFSGGYKSIVEGVNKTLDAIIEPVKEAALVLTEMANGNLEVSVKGDYKGDHADIKNALNGTIDSFNEVFTEINNAADQVSTGSNQVSDGSQALSQGTTEQASAIEELTSSITEVAAQTRQNAVNASQANELALNAKEGAILGNSHMQEMLKSMEEINESSSNISKIIKVIDDIAFQTNILALNAAVEAARAGQHGKGFAVVAEEVRNLAARSANAAKETTDLIEGSIKKVEFGTKIANNTAESLDQIVIGVSKAATLVGEIAAASNEQATAISQINKGIEQVSDVVQTNSATAEQSAAASEELSSQALMLKNMVGKFRIRRSTSIAYNEGSLETYRNLNVVKNKPRISLSNKDFGKY